MFRTILSTTNVITQLLLCKLSNADIDECQSQEDNSCSPTNTFDMCVNDVGHYYVQSGDKSGSYYCLCVQNRYRKGLICDCKLF